MGGLVDSRQLRQLRQLEEEMMVAVSKIVFVEWRGEKPFDVWCATSPTWIETFDVEWCERDQLLYYHRSGGGNYTLPDGDDGLSNLPEGIKTLEQFIQRFGMVEEETLWCTICEDRFPKDGLCDHIWWDVLDEWYTGPGYSE